MIGFEQDKPYILINGDCLEKMKELDENSVDAIVTDPPYGLNFMGEDFDNPKMMGQAAVVHGGLNRYAPGEKRTGYADCDMVKFQKHMTPIFEEALRVAKPGAHLLAFGGTRTYHRLACAIEDAGWEVRDCIMYVYGSGMPKGQNVGKQIEALLKTGKTNSRSLRKVEQDGEGESYTKKEPNNGILGEIKEVTRKTFVPEFEESKKWDGWNTQLKPSYEPIILARKPLAGTVANTVLEYGTGGLNIDACRVPSEKPIVIHSPARKTLLDSGHKDLGTWEETKGRFPANFIHDGSDEVLDCFPNTSKSSSGGMHTKGVGDNQSGNCYGKFNNGTATESIGYGDSGSVARFFYCAKASKAERDKNCERLLTWEQNQELTQLIERSNQLIKDISESMMFSLEDSVCNMTLCGNDSTGQFQTDFKSIISMAIKLITELKTSLSCQHLNTNDAILNVIRTSEESGINIVQLAEKLNNLKQNSINEKTDIAINAVIVLFIALSKIRNCAKVGNLHPTIKPLALMTYLVKLITPPGAIVLDPFMGSGTTGVAAVELGDRFIGIEKEEKYFEIAKSRMGDKTVEEEPVQVVSKEEIIDNL